MSRIIRYKYDIAFSFLNVDLPTADTLNNSLRIIHKTFFYPESEKENVFQDGDNLLRRVYVGESRMVAILYREGGGKDTWTRIEQGAIKSRGFREGYDFVKLMMLDASPVPSWSNPVQFYLGIDRWGVTGAAAVLSDHIQQRGGKLILESVSDRVARHAREAKFAKDRHALLNSPAGVQAARRLLEDLKISIQTKLDLVRSEQPDFKLHLSPIPNDDSIFMLEGETVTTEVHLKCPSANTLSDSCLNMQTFVYGGAFREKRKTPRDCRFYLD